MNRTGLIRLVLAVVLAPAPLAAPAQQALEIIPLRHRTVEQVLPVLQPLVEPGGTIGGSRGQLFVRASPGNLADIRRALEAIDRPARRLQISVRFDDALAAERRGIGVTGSVGSGGARIGITAEDARRAATERVDQRLQVLEGGQAFIFTGQETGSGFEVVPRLAGERVQLDVASQRGGQQVATSVTTQLGEWVEVAGTANASAANGARRAESTRVWLKVEEIPN
jgi:hypothetical protein